MGEIDTTQQSFTPATMQVSADKYHLSPAMRVGDMIWVSGQVGITPDRQVPLGLQAQTRQAFENLKTVLTEAGATLDDIVELTLLFTGSMGNLEPFHQVKDEYIRAPYPAITGFAVSALAAPEFLVEIRAVAVAGSAKAK